MTPPALRLERIQKRFGNTRALDGVSLSVRPGTVHALLGENGAGKTTLMRVAYGLIQPDAGRILVRGREVRMRTPAAAIHEGLGMVHQHFTNIAAMTVAENVALGGRGVYSRRRIAASVLALTERTGLEINPEADVSELSIGAQQRLEILKALARNTSILIMDEPTAVLAPSEGEELLRWLRAFADTGGSVVLITHKLREALAIADEITVLRYGRAVLTALAQEVTADDLARAMLGDAPPAWSSATNHAAGEVVLRVRGATLRDRSGVEHVVAANLEVSAGEILGIVALENSGYHHLLRAIAGREQPFRGEIMRDGSVGFIPEDRHRDALILPFSLTENVALKGSGAARGRMRWRAWRAVAQRLVQDFDVRAASLDVPARVLSGGNQQKLVLARELFERPPIVIAENPTRGLDIRATAEVHERLRSAARAGAGVIFYSSDLDEVLGIATRVIAVHAGRIREVPNERAAAGRAMLGLPPSESDEGGE